MILAPVDGPGGVGGGRDLRRVSRCARNDESKGAHDFYDKVYDAERPELFFKAAPGRVRGPGDRDRRARGLRLGRPRAGARARDLARGGEILGYTIGNDVSSRSIEGENPLYLPQAKVYAGSCALGPCIVAGRRARRRPSWRSR